jgi:hypothetical protein
VCVAVLAAAIGVLAAIGPARLMTDALPPAPDYAHSEAWAARPDRTDAADVALVPGTTDQQATAAADVFYLYAGSNWTLHWNAPVDHWLVSYLVDGPYMERFASVFSGCCRIYAPRYRQEAIAGPDGPRRERATEQAYADVRAAFRHYLEHENDGRPIVIAGSQSGGRHGLQLLIDEFAGRPLRAQLVAAYLVGAYVDADARAKLGDIPICDDATQLGCVNVWNAFGRAAKERIEAQDAACVNPLSWRADGGRVPRERNRGSISTQGWLRAPVVFRAGLVDAQCEAGVLWVTPPENDADYWQPGGPGDYHIYNYALFFADLRENAVLRVQRFVTKTPAAASFFH